MSRKTLIFIKFIRTYIYQFIYSNLRGSSNILQNSLFRQLTFRKYSRNSSKELRKWIVNLSKCIPQYKNGWIFFQNNLTFFSEWSTEITKLSTAVNENQNAQTKMFDNFEKMFNHFEKIFNCFYCIVFTGFIAL